MPRYSHSKLSTFEQCRFKYKLRYIDKIVPPGGETAEIFLGKMVHDALERLYSDLKLGIKNTLQQLLAGYNSKWDEGWNDDILIVREGCTKESYRWMGEKYLTDYYKRHHPFDRDRTIGLETSEFLDLGNGYLLDVRMDRLSEEELGIYVINDYKTQGRLPTQEKLDSDRQLALYSIWVREQFPDAKQVKLRWHYLAFDKAMESQRDALALERLKAQIKALIEMIEGTTEFPAEKSALCPWCEYQEMCPHFKHLYVAEEKKGEDADRMVMRFALLSNEKKKIDEEIEELRAKIIEYARENEVSCVYGKDSKVSVSEFFSMHFPKKGEAEREKLVSALKAVGLYDRLETIDTYELARILKSGELHDDVEKMLLKFVKKEKGYRVTVGKR